MAAVLPTLPELRGLLEITRLVRDERDLTRLVDGIAGTVCARRRRWSRSAASPAASRTTSTTCSRPSGATPSCCFIDLADDASARESAAEIARAAGRAASLTGQLLAFGRKQVLRPQELDLNEIVAAMSSMLGRGLGEDVVLTTALEHELWPTLADPTQLEQVMLNLAVNARDAMPRGGRLTIRTANVGLDSGHYVALVVADTGEGMNPATAERIFEPFFTRKEVGAGTGLGLATVHGIVAQGGTIEVASEPGVGTTFTICLPRAEGTRD